MKKKLKALMTSYNEEYFNKLVQMGRELATDWQNGNASTEEYKSKNEKFNLDLLRYSANHLITLSEFNNSMRPYIDKDMEFLKRFNSILLKLSPFSDTQINIYFLVDWYDIAKSWVDWGRFISTIEKRVARETKNYVIMKGFIEKGKKDVLLELVKNDHIFEYEDIGVSLSKNEDWEIRYEILKNSYPLSFYNYAHYQIFINDDNEDIRKFVALNFDRLTRSELKTLANDESQEVLFALAQNLALKDNSNEDILSELWKNGNSKVRNQIAKTVKFDNFIVRIATEEEDEFCLSLISNSHLFNNPQALQALLKRTNLLILDELMKHKEQLPFSIQYALPLRIKEIVDGTSSSEGFMKCFNWNIQ